MFPVLRNMPLQETPCAAGNKTAVGLGERMPDMGLRDVISQSPGIKQLLHRAGISVVVQGFCHAIFGSLV